MLRRRAPQLTDDVVAINGLRLDPATHRVTGQDTGGEAIKLDLGPTEFRLLHFLMTPSGARPQPLAVAGSGVGRPRVRRRAHGGRPYQRLRAAPTPGGYSNMIETVRGSGYRLARAPGA